MDELDFCRLADAFTLPDATALIIGVPPSSIFGPTYEGDYHLGRDDENNNKYQVVLQALFNAINHGTLEANKKFEVIMVGDRPYQRPENRINIGETTILVDNLRKWLSSRGFSTGFFFPDTANTPDYLDKNHPRYAPKLAAVVRAWQAMDDNEKLKGISPKKALDKYLRENAAAYGLTNDDGNPIEAAIEECSKVANWSQSGGAPKTPT